MRPRFWVFIVYLSFAVVTATADQPDRRAEPGASKRPLRAQVARGDPARAARAARARAERARPHTAGRLLWEDRYDQSLRDQAFAAVAHRGELFVAGFVLTSSGRDFLLRVLDQKTGELVWQDQVDRGGSDFASGVAADGDRVFVSGTTSTPATGADWLLRAYDTRTHGLLWEDTFDLVGRADFSRGTALTTGAGMVFLGGYATNEHDRGDFNTDWIVRAYDAGSGALVWQDRIAGFSGAYTLSYEAGRLFAGGWSNTLQADHAIVRAYDARGGTKLWTRRTPGAPGGNTYTNVVKAQGSRVFAAQAVTVDASTLAPRVKAFDARTGAQLWQDVVDTPGEDWIDDLDVSSHRVFVVGYGGATCRAGADSNCDAVVHGYHAASGARLWKQQLDLSGVDDFASLVKAEGGQVYVNSAAGPLSELPGCCTIGQWVVSALDDSHGRLLWQTLGDEGDSGVYNMVVDRGRLFIPGRAVDAATGNWDLIVRAYDARGRNGDVLFPTLRQLTAAGTTGTRSYDVTFDQAVTARAHGLVPAEEQAGTVADDPLDDINEALATGVGITFHTVNVPPDTRTLRVSLFDDETDGNDDLDLFVFDPDFNFVGSSGNATSNESFLLQAPVAGNYTVVVHGYQTDGPDASYTLFAWALGNAALGNLTLSGTNPVPAGGGRLTVSWTGLSPGGRYLGAVSYGDGTGELGQTLISIHAVP